jgi:hypothetical protein
MAITAAPPHGWQASAARPSRPVTAGASIPHGGDEISQLTAQRLVADHLDRHTLNRRTATVLSDEPIRFHFLRGIDRYAGIMLKNRPRTRSR